jgi:hypothetical protein
MMPLREDRRNLKKKNDKKYEKTAGAHLEGSPPPEAHVFVGGAVSVRLMKKRCQ